MTRSLETSRRVFRVSTLHEDARKVVGNDHYEGLVREAVSLLARLGATVPPEYVGRSCFYDITRDLKHYTDQSAQIRILFDSGVVLDGLLVLVEAVTQATTAWCTPPYSVRIPSPATGYYILAPH